MCWDQMSFWIFLTGYIILSSIKTIDKYRLELKKVKTISNDQQKVEPLIPKYKKLIINYNASYNSAFIVAGCLAESYLYGVRIVGNILSVILGFIYAYLFVQPFMYSLDEDIKTPFQYFERRYRNKKYVRAITAAAGMLFYFLFLTLYLWGCAVLLTTLIPEIPLWISVVAIGVYSIIGSTIGGFTQTTKTNIFQFLILIIGLILLLVLTVRKHKYFKPEEIWSVAVENKRTNFIETSADFTTRYTILNQCLSLSIPWTCVHSLLLPNFVRYRNIPCKSKSRNFIISNLPSMIVVYTFLFVSGGILCFIHFYGCDPIFNKQFENKNQVGVHWIYKILSEHVPSYTGILFASLIGYTVVQHSMGMALCGKTLIGEIIKPIVYDLFNFTKNSKKLIEWSNIISSVLLGFLSIGLSISFAYVRNTMLSLFFVFNNSINSPIIGLYFLSVFNPYANHFGAMLAFISNLSINFWLASGAVLFSRLKSQEFQPHTFSCNQTNFTFILNQSLAMNNLNSTQEVVDFYPKNPTLAYLYSISSIWYCLFSFIFMIVFGSLFSLVYSFVKNRSFDADSDFKEERKQYLFIYRMFKKTRVQSEKPDLIQITSF
ncbi:unnamed protein product [Brachionus calyciflorus]|uniref:Uncharacterized protein n=1 Tax=Brachionus calyciflorus TaxID=104777 RepID=A0A813RYA6_9BILA|nr:unnamed protein product [Brachionus calyciflorus]